MAKSVKHPADVTESEGDEPRPVAGVDLDLGETDEAEPFVSAPPERRIITQGYDLSVTTLVEQWDTQILSLPEFQREYLWDNGKASRLIESLLLGIPIPVLYFFETPQATYEIIDGHQRVRSVARFIHNQFALTSLRVLGEFKGKRFHRLPEREQRFLKTRVMRAIIVSNESAPTMKFEIFGRLNTGSIQLNAQEVRNALYTGSLNDQLKELELEPHFRQCVGTRVPRARMVDRELILRFLGLRHGLTNYRPPLLKFLNGYMNQNRNPAQDGLTTNRTVFTDAIRRVHALWGSAAFRVTDERGVALERNVNRALFDTQMLTCSWIASDEVLVARRTRVLKRVAKLYEDDAFQDTIRRATGDRARLLNRVQAFAAAFEAVGIPVALPHL